MFLCNRVINRGAMPLLVTLISLLVLVGSQSQARNQADNNAADTEKRAPGGKGTEADIPVTRWPEEDPNRPTPFDQWRAGVGSAGPFHAETVRRGVPVRAEYDPFYIFVNAGLQNSIQSALDQYMADLSAEGYPVVLVAVSGGTPEEFRAFLNSKYLEGMRGGLVIGDLPVAWYERTCWDWNEHEEFPCDLFYMDLDGVWTDGDGDGLYDAHTGDTAPEIYLGRLTASPMRLGGADEASLLQNYFRKNHAYRSGHFPVIDRGLLYVDDDWAPMDVYWGDCMEQAYPLVTVVSDPYVTVAEDYEDRLTHNYEMIQVAAHSTPHDHYFYQPSGPSSTTSAGEVVDIDPQAAFYNLYACSNARYIENDYMAGWYIFCQEYGLLSIGSTKTGSMLYFYQFYSALASGKTFGAAYSDWFTFVLSFESPDFCMCWFYGMTLCGDPTLRPHQPAPNPTLAGMNLDDFVFGDGDGIPESGETIDLYCTVVNLGTETAINVFLGLALDDATIVIDDGTASLGDLGPGDSAINMLDPMRFSIPSGYVPRIDSLFLIVSWNNGACVDTAAMEQALGGASVVLLDDDDGNAIEGYYQEFLYAARIPYDVREIAGQYPQVSELDEYDLVVWFTGPYREQILSPEAIALMTNLLSGGGNLFLSAQGVASQLQGSAPEFLTTYLKSEYVSTGYYPVLHDDPFGGVFDYTDSICVTAAGGSSYHSHMDQIAAVNGGVSEWRYFVDENSGAVSYAGDYRVVFFSFGFEGILNGNSRWADRDSLYADILDFVNLSRPGSRPQVLGVSVSPGDPQQMTDHTPYISWTYSDPGKNPQQMYQVQVGGDDFWNFVEMWDYGPITGPETTILYAGASLEDGQQYFIRVRACDGALWSDWTGCCIRMNSVPQPIGLRPSDMQVVPDINVDLTHINLPDGEGDTLTYDYELYADSQLSSLVAAAEDRPAGWEPLTVWTVPEPLVPGEDYYWRVRAADHLEHGEWSDPAAFFVFSSAMCGEANGDGSLNVGDAIFVINYVFKNGPAAVPECAGDANGDTHVNVADAVFVINYVFKNGPIPQECCQ